MKDSEKGLMVNNFERCSNCVRSKSWVARMGGGSVEDGGKETKWTLMESIPIGQSRHCRTQWQKWFWSDWWETFIYPGEDDTCINPKRFKSRAEEEDKTI